jgi:hypothetical protein
MNIVLNSDSQECLYATKSNYTTCEDTTTSNDMIDPVKIKKIVNISDDEIDQLLKNNTIIDSISPINESVDHKFIFIFLFFSSFHQVLFISDKKNHCIRIFYINQNVSDTYAGDCGEAGFHDGPFGENRFNSPESLGVDALGNVFVFDQDNNYIRMIMPNSKNIITIHFKLSKK